MGIPLNPTIFRAYDIRGIVGVDLDAVVYRRLGEAVGSYFAGGVETEEQLEAALDGVREECARLIGAGKKVIVQ